MPTSFCQLLSPNVGKRQRRKEDRPKELLAAALQLFVEKGFAATRAEEVARMAGVSKGTLFLYFSSKEELFKAVVRENISGNFPQWNARFEAFEGSTADMVRVFLAQWWETIGDSPVSGIVKLMTSEASNFPELAAFYEQEVIIPGSELIQRILRRGVERGEFVPMDPHYGVYTLLAPMLFLATWKHSFGACQQFSQHIQPAEYLRTQAEFIVRGLSVARPSPSAPASPGYCQT